MQRHWGISKLLIVFNVNIEVLHLIISSLVQASATIKTGVLCAVISVHKAIPAFKPRLADAGVASISVHASPIVPTRVGSCTFVDVQLTASTLVAKWTGAGELVEVAIR